MARQIGKMLNTREPKIISGPGKLFVLFLYVGIQMSIEMSWKTACFSVDRKPEVSDNELAMNDPQRKVASTSIDTAIIGKMFTIGDLTTQLFKFKRKLRRC